MTTTQPRYGGREYRRDADRAERERRGCEVCGEWFPYQMLQWHHVNGRDVRTQKGRSQAYHLPTMALMRYEWTLCICVCPNCHVIADYERDNA